MFKFNFDKNSENIEKDKMFDNKSTSGVVKESKLIEFNSNQYTEIAQSLMNYSCKMFTTNQQLEIGFIENLNINENSKSDLIAGVYEGGFKVWECTNDLADYLTDENSSNVFEGKVICDLGCSAGILGIIALKLGANAVHFQDYNEDVLQNFTIPNVILNCEEAENPEAFHRCSFYSGDWDSFRDLTASLEKYDLILTSETIYNPQNYSKLVNLFKSRLKKGGKVFLAAKSHYFGVGGNVFDFCKYLNDDGNFNYQILWKSNEGLQREILLIQLK